MRPRGSINISAKIQEFTILLGIGFLAFLMLNGLDLIPTTLGSFVSLTIVAPILILTTQFWWGQFVRKEESY